MRFNLCISDNKKLKEVPLELELIDLFKALVKSYSIAHTPQLCIKD